MSNRYKWNVYLMFHSSMGVRQGDCMSSTLFTFFINDLAVELKTLLIGININGLILYILLFAVNSRQ